jgi:hypothetical protein
MVEKEKSGKTTVSRRDFLVASGAVLASGALAACTQNSGKVTTSPMAMTQGALTLEVNNPRGELDPVPAKGLSNPRITTLEGKKIGLYAIKTWSTPWIEKVLKTKYPTATFVALTTDTVKEVDAFIAATGD